MWSAGEQVVLRSWVDGRLGWVIPVTVVNDAPDYIALYRAVGTPIKQPVRLDGSPIPRSWPYERRFRVPWRLGDGIWHTEATLILARPGVAHAVTLCWHGADWSFHGWYVDLQAPLQRTSLGFDSEDQVLDIVVDLDGTWRWKDADEFAAAQRTGRFTAAHAAAIRSEALTVIDRIKTWDWPFNAGWEHWRPDPSWTIPSLPIDWDLDWAANRRDQGRPEGGFRASAINETNPSWSSWLRWSERKER